MSGFRFYGSPLFDRVQNWFHYLIAVLCFLGPPICAIFLAAIIWPRCTAIIWALFIEIVLGSIRFSIEFVPISFAKCGGYGTEPKENGELLLVTIIKIMRRFRYLHFGFLLWIISTSIAVLVSLLTPAIPKRCVCLHIFYLLEFRTLF